MDRWNTYAQSALLRARMSLPSAGAYRGIAPYYDRAVGRPFFGALRCAFDTLVARYGIRFRDALDLGCGTGLFARHLAERYGASVLGIDSAPAMLAIARQQCRSCKVGFMLQDLRDLSLPYRFDLVTANFDTLNHLRNPKDVRRVLQTVLRLLRPNGHLLFDLLTPAAARCLGVGGERNLSLAGGLIWQRLQVSAGAREIITTLRVSGAGRTQPPLSERQVERLYRAVEVGRWLAEAGFVVRALLDAETLTPALAEPARALFVAQRVG